MTTTTHIHVRDARDRLIDLLGIGQTYPLQDLAVRDEQLTVAFNTAAHIPIENSQKGVLYQLHDKDNTLVTRTPAGAQGAGVPVQAEGNGDTILLETYKIQEDVTFKIRARKLQSGREAYLHQTATVKVGLDVTLQAWIRDVPLLEPTSERPAPTDPRIISYGTSVEVEISNSQEGVDYHLVSATASGQAAEEVLSVASGRGNLHDITLRTKPISEDTDLRIRATKTFDPAENRDSQTALLDSVLPLKVRANPALQVAVASAIVDFQQATTVTIAETQRSVHYQIFLRPIPDRDFVHTSVPAAEVLTVPVAGKPDVQVHKPERGDVWATPPGYTAASVPQPGTGGALAFTTPALTDDSLLIVQASKEHQAAHVVSSAIQLEQTAVILVRPNPAPALRLVPVEPAATSRAFQVFDGQPGVFYSFRREPERTALGLPVYFHQKDETDQTVNKGLDQLMIDVDFVVAAEEPPAAPILETGVLPAGTICSVLAVKAQTGVEVELAQSIRLDL
jgi:hypothetical protein